MHRQCKEMAGALVLSVSCRELPIGALALPRPEKLRQHGLHFSPELLGFHTLEVGVRGPSMR